MRPRTCAHVARAVSSVSERIETRGISRNGGAHEAGDMTAIFFLEGVNRATLGAEHILL